MGLASVAIRHLRGLGHHLDPIVQVGKEGVTEGLVAAASRALRDHELVKVRVASEAPEDRKETAAALALAAGAELVQVIGRTFLIYKRNPKKPKIVLPKVTKPKVRRTKPKAKAGAPAAKPDTDDDADGDDETPEE